MEPQIGRLNASIIGLFLLLTLGCAALGLFAIAEKDGWSSETITVASELEQVNGLRVGAPVRVLGIPVGKVIRIEPPQLPGQPVVVELQISKQQQNLVRKDAKLRILKDGLVGERLVEIDPGTESSPPIAAGDRIASANSPSWEEVVAKVDAVVEDVQQGKGTIGQLLRNDDAHQRLLAVATEGQQVLKRIDNIAQDIESGRGTAGKLLKDDTAYRELQDLVQRAEVALAEVDESHRSLKQTWPLSRLVQDRYQLLVRPDAQTHTKTFEATDLFEPGQARLTDAGKKKLDEIAAWLHEFDNWESDVVVAGFAQGEQDTRLAEVVSSKQAEAVRDYLIEKNAHQRGWISRRSITAIGFGNASIPNKDLKAPQRGIALLAFVK